MVTETLWNNNEAFELYYLYLKEKKKFNLRRIGLLQKTIRKLTFGTLLLSKQAVRVSQFLAVVAREGPYLLVDKTFDNGVNKMPQQFGRNVRHNGFLKNHLT